MAVIPEGTAAVSDVSAADRHLRRKRERVKEKLLANLHMFVSPLRLVVHNLPLDMTDVQLKHLFRKYAPAKARIVEVCLVEIILWYGRAARTSLLEICARQGRTGKVYMVVMMQSFYSQLTAQFKEIFRYVDCKLSH
jgi:hypothetical protein